MSEIKVGDNCRVSGWCWPYHPEGEHLFYDDNWLSDDMTDILMADNLKATVLAIDEHMILIEINDKYTSVFYHGVYAVHRKQCRKLVKSIACSDCKPLFFGKSHGYTHMSTKDVYGNEVIFRVICEKCNGTGKVKIADCKAK